MDSDIDKIEQLMLKRQEFFLSLLQPVVQEIIKESDELIKLIKDSEPNECFETPKAESRPRRNAAKTASNKILNQLHMDTMKLRRPDEKDVTGNIYDCLTENKRNILQDCSNIKRENSIRNTNCNSKIASDSITLSDCDENIICHTPLNKKDRKKVEKVSSKNASVRKGNNKNSMVSDKTPKKLSNQNKNTQIIITNVNKNMDEVNIQYNVKRENKFLGYRTEVLENIPEVSVCEDDAANISIEELLNLSPPYEKIKVKKFIKNDKLLFCAQVILKEMNASEISKEDFSKPAKETECSIDKQQSKFLNLRVDNNDATFLLGESNIAKHIKIENCESPPRVLENIINQTIVIENLITPVKKTKNVIVSSKKANKESVMKTNCSENQVGLLSSQVYPLIKVTKLTNHTPRIVQQKTASKNSCIKNSSEINKKLSSKLKAKISPAKKKSVKKLDLMINCTPKSYKQLTAVTPLSVSKTDSIKKNNRGTAASKNKEQLLWQRQEELKSKLVEKERLAQPSHEQREKIKLEKESSMQKIREQILHANEMKEKNELQKKKLNSQQKIQEMDKKHDKHMVTPKLKKDGQMKLQLEQKCIEQPIQQQESVMQLQQETHNYNMKKSIYQLNESVFEMEEIPETAMCDGFENLGSDYSTDEEDKPTKSNIERPAWCNFNKRSTAMIQQARVSPYLIDTFFSVKASTPDLRKIFPGINKEKLRRKSSAVWKTPPRYSLLQNY